VRIKRLLSVVLCLVFVMSLFPLSGAAKSDHFVAEDDEQNISVYDAVYAEKANDIDNGVCDDISLDDMNTEDESEMPCAIPAGANMMQMMAIEGNGDDTPIMGETDLKISYEFPVVTGNFEVCIPNDDVEGEDRYEWCQLGFVPRIEECATSFYIANGLNGESVFTIRENDIGEKASIKEDIYIGNPELVEAGKPYITFSEEYYDDTGVNYSYDIIFQVDFRSKYISDDMITLEYRLTVYDSPLIGIDADYNGQTHSYLNDSWFADGDIWNSMVHVNVMRESGEDDPNLRIEPVENVGTNIFYYWGNSDAPYCIFRPAENWATTGPDGKATFTVGNGGFLVERDIGVPAPALYGKLVKEVGLDNLSQYYTYPDLKDFNGIIKVKVVNTAGESLKGRTVQFWGGAKYDDLGGGITDDDGIAEIRYPSSTTSTDRAELTMTELPTFIFKWNLTQVIDNPAHIVDGHNAPLYLSPEIKVSEGYFENPYTQIKDVKLQVYDVNNPEKALIETPPTAFKEKYEPRRDIMVRGAHRAYIEIKPQDLAGKRLGIRAVVRNKDEGAREEYQVRGYVEDPVSLCLSQSLKALYANLTQGAFIHFALTSNIDPSLRYPSFS
jgi:hypothetical protein